MDTIIEHFNHHDKVDRLKTHTIPSLSDRIQYSQVEIIVKTRFNRYDWAKGVFVFPHNDKYRYIVNIYETEPKKGELLYDFYHERRFKDVDKCNSTRDKLTMLCTIDDIRQLINYVYSINN